MIAGLSGSVDEGSDRVVAAGDLAHGAASGVRSARVQEARLAGGTRNGFDGTRTAGRKRIESTYSSGSRVMRVEPSQASVVSLSAVDLDKPRVGPLRALALVQLEQTRPSCACARGGARRLRHRQQGCRKEGVGRSRMASSVPVSTLRHRSSRSDKASSSWASNSARWRGWRQGVRGLHPRACRTRPRSAGSECRRRH